MRIEKRLVQSLDVLYRYNFQYNNWMRIETHLLKKEQMRAKYFSFNNKWMRIETPATTALSSRAVFYIQLNHWMRIETELWTTISLIKCSYNHIIVCGLKPRYIMCKCCTYDMHPNKLDVDWNNDVVWNRLDAFIIQFNNWMRIETDILAHNLWCAVSHIQYIWMRIETHLWFALLELIYIQSIWMWIETLSALMNISKETFHSFLDLDVDWNHSWIKSIMPICYVSSIIKRMDEDWNPFTNNPSWSQK